MDATLLINALLPAAGRPMRVQHLAIVPGGIVILLACQEASACCPLCSQPSSRVSSRYLREVADMPWRQMPVLLRLEVRRFFCDTKDCKQKVFSEQFPLMLRKWGRSTLDHEKALVRLGLVCGGEPGARLAAELGMPSSGDTILRRLRRVPPAERVAPAPVCVGIDDFALHKGHRYGTVIVDHESGAVWDILPERSSESTAAFLAGQPQIGIVTRDRAELYANGISAGRPEAVQVADRFHVQENLREAVVRLLDRHHREIAIACQAACSEPQPAAASEAPALEPLASEAPELEPVASQAPASTPANAPESAPAPMAAAQTPTEPSTPPLSKRVLQSMDRRDRRFARYEQVISLRKQQLSVRAIRKQTGCSLATIIKYLRAAGFPEHARPQRRRIIDPFVPTLRALWDAGEHRVEELHRKLQALGFTGSVHMVNASLAPWRKAARAQAREAPSPIRISSKRLSWLLLHDKIEPKPGEQKVIDQLRQACDAVRHGVELAREFRAIFQQHQSGKLLEWIGRAQGEQAPVELINFARGIEKEWPSMKAAVELPWSNGRAEGHVNRIKLIKRQMYGRANFDLLRIRVLARGP
jgi:transposase